MQDFAKLLGKNMLKLTWTIALLTALPTALLAEPASKKSDYLQQDTQAVLDCLNNPDNEHNKESKCTNVVFKPCNDSANGVNMFTAMFDCMNREIAAWNNVKSQRIQSIIEVGGKAYSNNIDETELAWEEYVEKKCSIYQSVYRGGRMASSAIHYCKMLETRSRINDLTELLKTLEKSNN